MATREELARRSIVELVREVFDQRGGRLQPVSYDELARRIDHLTAEGKPVSIAMGGILSVSGHLLQDIRDEWGVEVPHLTALVVAKEGRPDAGLPSEGMKEFWPTYPQMTPEEKERKAFAELEQIANFGSRWNDVLQALGLPEVRTTVSDRPIAVGGESREHIALKTYVSEHPACVGARPGSTCHIEYPLPSGDQIDVFFKSTDEWLAVEVKASISDRLSKDYERGLYQTIKYYAVLAAMARAHPHDAPKSIRSVLVLQSTLPPAYDKARAVLGIDVVERVGVEISNTHVTPI